MQIFSSFLQNDANGNCAIIYPVVPDWCIQMLPIRKLVFVHRKTNFLTELNHCRYKLRILICTNQAGNDGFDGQWTDEFTLAN